MSAEDACGTVFEDPEVCAPSSATAVAVAAVINTLPAEGGERVHLILLDADGDVVASADGPLELLEVVTVAQAQPPFTAVIHAPDDPSWDASSPFGSGAYAILRDITDLPVTLLPYAWTQASSLDDVPDGGAGRLDEPPPHRTASGQLVDPDGLPVFQALVLANTGEWTYADGNGELTLDKVIADEVSLSITASGIDETIDVSSAGSSLGVIQLSAPLGPSTTYSFRGRLVDRDSGAAVAGGEVYVDGQLVATSDASGHVDFTAPHPVTGVQLRGTDYAIGYQLIYPCSDDGAPCSAGAPRTDLELFPLDQRFYGRWEYCQSTDLDWGGSEGDPYVASTPGLGTEPPEIFSTQEFRDDGTADRRGFGFAPWLATAWKGIDKSSVLVPATNGFHPSAVGIGSNYGFKGGYLINYDAIADARLNYYRPEGSDLPCLNEDGGPGGGAGPCDAYCETFVECAPGGGTTTECLATCEDERALFGNFGCTAAYDAFLACIGGLDDCDQDACNPLLEQVNLCIDG